MSEVHRALLTHNRTFLLRNIFPSEEFWSLLLEKELLTSDMLEDITVGAHSRHRASGRMTFIVGGHLHVNRHRTKMVQAS